MVTDEEQSIYKCVKSVPLMAKNGIFKESITFRDQFSFVKSETDKQRPIDETGYVSPAVGDSGSPYWTTKREAGKLKAVLLAVVSFNLKEPTEAYASYSNDPFYQCRIGATKITDDILRWIKEQTNIVTS